MFSDPQFWVAIAFVTFVAVVFNPIRKILISNLDTKIKEIKDKIEEAENIKNEAQITLSEIKKKQNEVKNEINIINEDAKKRINILEKESEHKIKDQIEKKQFLAEAKIDQLTRDANNEIHQKISYTAIEATIALLEKKLDKEKKQNLINNSINEINSVLKN